MVCNNFRAAGGGAYPHLPDAEVASTSAVEMAELIGQYLEQYRSWQPTVDGNWWIAPDLAPAQQDSPTDPEPR